MRLCQGADIGSGVKVVHNYGHGGSGVTLSWGCAGEVVYFYLHFCCFSVPLSQVVSIVERILSDMAANAS